MLWHMDGNFFLGSNLLASLINEHMNTYNFVYNGKARQCICIYYVYKVNILINNMCVARTCLFNGV